MDQVGSCTGRIELKRPVDWQVWGERRDGEWVEERRGKVGEEWVAPVTYTCFTFSSSFFLAFSSFFSWFFLLQKTDDFSPWSCTIPPYTSCHTHILASLEEMILFRVY